MCLQLKCTICIYIIKDISTKISEHICVNHRTWTTIVSRATCNITLDNIRLDSPMADKNFVSEKQCTPPLTSDFYASTDNCICGCENYIVLTRHYRSLNRAKSHFEIAHRTSGSFCFVPLRHTRVEIYEKIILLFLHFSFRWTVSCI